VPEVYTQPQAQAHKKKRRKHALQATRKNMKKFTIEVSHASPGQLQTIALELKIMSNGWARHGPRIKINGEKLQAPRLHESRTKLSGPGRPSNYIKWRPSFKPQAPSRKRHNMARFI